MIFITSEKPLFRAYVNGIVETTGKNGGIIKKLILGTSEKKQDDTREYSSWFAILNGNARKKFDENPLTKGDLIEIYSFKETNVSKKMENGEYSNPFFNMAIMDYNVKDGNNTTVKPQEENKDEDENPF